MPRYKIAVEFMVEASDGCAARSTLDREILDASLTGVQYFSVSKPVEIVEMPDPESAEYQESFRLEMQHISESPAPLVTAQSIARLIRDPKNQKQWGKIAAANAYIQEQQRQALGIDHQAEAQRRETW